MRYVKKVPPPDQNLRDALISGGWNKIKEPSNLVAFIAASVPFMVLAGLISFYVIEQLYPDFTNSMRHMFATGSIAFTIRLDYILFAYLLTILHELIHAMFIPRFIRSEKVFFGIRPWGGFVGTSEKLSKNRYLLISLAPFLVLSIFLPILLGLLNALSNLLALLIMLNAVASSVDLFTALLIAFQVPGNSQIISNGFETYYK